MNPAQQKSMLENGYQPGAGAAQLNRRAPAPAFRPHVLRSIQARPLLTAGVAGVCLLLLVAYAFSLKPVWLAESQVYVEPAAAKLIGDQGVGFFDSVKYETYLQQQIQTATRNDILESAIASLPPGTWRQPDESLASATARLASQLSIKRVTTSYQLAIGLKDGDPVKAAAIVNAVTQAYLRAGRKDELTQTDQRVQLLHEERDRITQELSHARNEQAALSVSLGVANASGEGANPYDMQLAELRTQLAAAREAHQVAAAQLSAYTGPSTTRVAGLAAAADELIGADAGLSSMKSTINSRRAQLESQMAGLTPGNPVYKQDQTEIADLDRSLETMTVAMRERASRHLEDCLKTDLDRTGDIEARLNAQLGRQTAAATGAAPKLQRAAELAADIQRLMARYASVDDSLRSLQLDASGPGMVHLALAAAVPNSPEPDRRRLLLLAALPLSLFLGAAAAVFARKRDAHIYLPSDLEQVLGFAPLAVLPAREEVSYGVIREYNLRLASGVESAFRGGGARSFVFTALSPETRLDDLLIALEARLGDLGLRILTLEASSLLHANPQDATAGTLSVPQRMHEGHVAANLERFKQEQDVVLISAPPVLLSAHAEYIARSSDATILVAESGVTTRAQASHGGSLLRRLHVSGIGSVLAELHLRDADAAFRATIQRLERDGIPGATAARPIVARDAESRPETLPAQPDRAATAVQEQRDVEVPTASDLPTAADLPSMTAAAPVAQAATLEEAPTPSLRLTAPQPPNLRAGTTQETEPATGVRQSWLGRLMRGGEETVYRIVPDATDEDLTETKTDDKAQVEAQQPDRAISSVEVPAIVSSRAEGAIVEQRREEARARRDEEIVPQTPLAISTAETVLRPAAAGEANPHSDLPPLVAAVISRVRPALASSIPERPARAVRQAEPGHFVAQADRAQTSRAVPTPLPRPATPAPAPPQPVAQSSAYRSSVPAQSSEPSSTRPVTPSEAPEQARPLAPDPARWERIPLLRPETLRTASLAPSDSLAAPRSDSSSAHRRSLHRPGQEHASALTRRWGLLSRFEDEAEAKQDDPALTSGRR